MTDATTLDDYPGRSFEKLRYADTDRQGHVNNAIFSTMFETGRVELFHHEQSPLLKGPRSFVIASIKIDYLREVLWPGTVEIGTRVTDLGRSSLKLDQAVFQNGACAARASSVLVLTDNATRKSTPLPEDGRAFLARYMKAG